MGLLIALLGTGKGTWLEVHGLLGIRAFEHTLLFIDEWAAKDYRNEYGARVIAMPADAPITELTAFFAEHIKSGADKGDFDIALNIASGTGKQHAALLGAALQSGFGVRLVSFENGELKVLT